MQLARVCHADAQIPDHPVLEIVDPAMHRQGLLPSPGILNACGLADMDDLFDDIEFTQSVMTGICLENCPQITAKFVIDVAYVANPIVRQPDAPVLKGGAHTRAAVVPHHNDVLHIKVLNRKLNDGQNIQVSVNHQIGNVAVNKNLSWSQARDLIGRHSRVGATDPQIFRILLVCKTGEKRRIRARSRLHPLAIVFKQLSERVGVTFVFRHGPSPDIHEQHKQNSCLDIIIQRDLRKVVNPYPQPQRRQAKMNRRQLMMAMGSAALGTICPNAFAQIAQKQLKFIVGYPAGGVADFVGRQIADGLTQQTGTGTLVENKVGFAGNISMEYVAKQPPDQATYGVFSNSIFTTHPFVPSLKSKGSDPNKDLVPVAALADMILVLAVSSQYGVNNLEEFLAKSNEPGRRVRIGLAGVGTSHHLSALLLQQTAVPNAMLIPYKGGAPMIVDAAGGHVDAVFTTVPVGGPMVQAGKMKWIAIAQPRSIQSLPGIPTLERVFKGASIPSWMGVYTTAAMPESQIDLMHAQLNKVANSPQIAEKLRANGLEPLNLSRKQTEQRLRDEYKFMENFLSNIKLDFAA